MKNILRVGLVVAAFGAVLPLRAAETKNATQPGQMDAATMQMMKLMEPSDGHAALDPLIGNFNATVKFWMDPTSKVNESTGTSRNSWILGHRFLKQDYRGTMDGRPFEGMGLTGYDNMRQEYQSIWADSMATGMAISDGKLDGATKILKQDGSFSCPMTGEKEHHFRSELKIVSASQHLYTSYSAGPDGKEFKNMEITYTRQR